MSLRTAGRSVSRSAFSAAIRKCPGHGSRVSGRHELDGVEGREPMQKPILVTLRQPRFIARLLQHGSVGTLDLRHDPVDDGTHAVRPSEKNFSILAN